MKTPIYVFQHWIEGEIVEEVASFNLPLLKKKADEIEKEIISLNNDDEDAVVRQEDGPGVYYSYDAYARDESMEENEILIKEIPFINGEITG
jgi:hypothetical protein